MVSSGLTVSKANPPKLAGTVTVGKQPSGLRFNAAGSLALVANRVDKSVSVLSVKGTDVSRDSPDDSRTGVNSSSFPACLEYICEVRTAAGTWGSRKGGRGADLAIFTGIWTHSCRRLLLNA